MEKIKTNIFQNFFEIVGMIWKLDFKYILFSICSMFINGIFPSMSLITIQKIINKIQMGENFEKVFILIIIYLGIDLIQSIYGQIINYYNSKFGMIFSLSLSDRILTKASKLSLSDYEKSNTYDLINRAQNEGGTKLISYYNNFINILTNIITLLSYIIILISFNLWIVLIILILPSVNYIISNKFNKKIFMIMRERTNEYRKSWYITYLLTYGNFYKELKIFNLFNYFIEKYKNYIQKFNDQDLKIGKKQLIIYSVLNILEIVIDGLLFAYTVLLGTTGIILIGNVITYTQTIISSKKIISSILLTISGTIKESLFIDQLFEYLNLEEEVHKNKIEISKINSIEFKNVSYRYSNNETYVLKNINFLINTNEKIALLGVNGSGKTTLIKILMGFYSDYEGEILINEINLKEIDKQILLERISAVFQDFVKYEDTFRKNISYSNFNIMYDDSVLYKIIEKFKLTDLINSKDKKIDTQLGLWFDDGINLSAGQWQKIALTRAFCKNADMYILDEPNASMDPIIEYEVSNLYKDILKDKIGIIITHKINNIVGVVDKIIVLENGIIVEEGTHDQLIKKNGLYHTLYDLSISKVKQQ